MADWEALVKTPRAVVDGMRLNLMYAQSLRMHKCDSLSDLLQSLEPNERRAALENMKQMQRDKEIQGVPEATVSTDENGKLVLVFPGCPDLKIGSPTS